VPSQVFEQTPDSPSPDWTTAAAQTARQYSSALNGIPNSTFRICLILVGFVFLALLWVLNAVFAIIASIEASDGKFYRYPMTIRFIQ
jgi:uncharacterized Tic20 family protein